MSSSPAGSAPSSAPKDGLSRGSLEGSCDWKNLECEPKTSTSSGSSANHHGRSRPLRRLGGRSGLRLLSPATTDACRYTCTEFSNRPESVPALCPRQVRTGGPHLHPDGQPVGRDADVSPAFRAGSGVVAHRRGFGSQRRRSPVGNGEAYEPAARVRSAH
jgi:hypothetical protein